MLWSFVPELRPNSLFELALCLERNITTPFLLEFNYFKIYSRVL